MRKNAIWITWENQRRNRELSRAFGIKLYELAYIDNIKNPLKKYLTGIGKTIRILLREKPKLVICQNPSLILSFFLVSLKRLTKLQVVVDAHNAGLFPKECRFAVLNLISRFIQRKADMTIVTNENLKANVEMNGGHAFVLPDRIPNILVTKPKEKLKGRFNILFICRYASDEPYKEVFAAASKLDHSIYIYVTGDYSKGKISTADLPENVILTGFILESEYFEMLNSVDATIDLTTRENCLVCGAYETVAVEKPMILSKTKALMDYFSMGAIYTENTLEGIEKAILEVIERKAELTAQVKEWKAIRQVQWEQRKKDLERIFLR